MSCRPNCVWFCYCTRIYLPKTQLSLTNRATHLCRMQRRSWPRKAPPHACVTTSNFGRSRSNRVVMSIGENRRNWGALGPRLLGMEGVADLLKTSPCSICITTLIWYVLYVKGCKHGQKEPPKLGSAGVPPLWDGVVAGCTTRNTLLSTCVTLPSLFVLGQPVRV